LPNLKFEELESELARGRFYPIYLLHGPEELLVSRAISLLKERAVTPEAMAFNYSEHSGQNADVSEIVKDANTYPMMSPRRFVLVTEMDKIAEPGRELLSVYAGNPQEKTVLVLAAAEVDRRTSFFKRLAERAAVLDFPKLKCAALERWAGNQLSGRGYRISPPALKKFVDLAGSDLLTLSAEMEKLILYCGSEKEIRDAAVEELVQASRQHGIFELTTAMGNRDRRLALKHLGNLLEAGEPALWIVSMIARHFRQVLIAKELLAEGRQAAEIGRIAQVLDWVLQDFLRQVRATDFATARNLYERLARIDRSFKSSSPDERMLLEHLVCSL
jgi:DNA polymerase-3 subunit delta